MLEKLAASVIEYHDHVVGNRLVEFHRIHEFVKAVDPTENILFAWQVPGSKSFKKKKKTSARTSKKKFTVPQIVDQFLAAFKNKSSIHLVNSA